MAVVWPSKNNFANGDVLTAANMNNIADTLNVFNPTSATAGQVWTANGSGSGSFQALSSAYVLVKPTSVSTTSGTATINSSGSVTLSTAVNFKANGVFTSTYENYFMVLTYTTATVGFTGFRYMAAGVEEAASYNEIIMRAAASAWSVTQSSGNSLGRIIENDTSQINNVYTMFFRPQMTNRKVSRSWGQPGTSSNVVYDVQVVNTTTTAYDGVYIPTTAMTGLVSFYGLAK